MLKKYEPITILYDVTNETAKKKTKADKAQNIGENIAFYWRYV